MPENIAVFDAAGTNLGSVELVGGEISDTSRVKSWYWWSILPGLRYYDDRVPISLWWVPLPPLVVIKAGATTGMTWGVIQEYDNRYNPCHGTILEDQGIASLACAPGDSGAPVFRLSWTPTGELVVSLFGVLWGGENYCEEQEVYTTAIFSPINDVLEEMGVEPQKGL